MFFYDVVVPFFAVLGFMCVFFGICLIVGLLLQRDEPEEFWLECERQFRDHVA